MAGTFDGLDMTGWERYVGGGPGLEYCRRLKNDVYLWIDEDGSLAYDGIEVEYLQCTSVAAAYTLANQIAEATGGWKE